MVSSKKMRLILIECPNDVTEQKQATANGNMEDVGESVDRFPATEESSNIEISKNDVPDTLRHRLATKKMSLFTERKKKNQRQVMEMGVKMKVNIKMIRKRMKNQWRKNQTMKKMETMMLKRVISPF